MTLKVCSSDLTIFRDDEKIYVKKVYFELKSRFNDDKYSKNSDYQALVIFDGDFDIRKNDKFTQGKIEKTLEEYHLSGGTVFTVSEIKKVVIRNEVLTTEVLS